MCNKFILYFMICKKNRKILLSIFRDTKSMLICANIIMIHRWKGKEDDVNIKNETKDILLYKNVHTMNVSTRLYHKSMWKFIYHIYLYVIVLYNDILFSNPFSFSNKKNFYKFF